MAVWDDDTKSPIAPPDWLFTGHMLLSGGKSARARALQVLASYLRLTEWYEEDLGLLELK
jgi:hypothetical protein